MNIEAIKNEIESRLNPETYSITSNDLSDIINMFDIDEQDVAFIYSQVVDGKRKELETVTKKIIDYFRNKGNDYPSFEEFKTIFKQYNVQPDINNNILKDMHKNEIKKAQQFSLFEIKEIIQEVISEIGDPEELERIKKAWGGELPPEEEFSAEEFFGAAGDAAQDDIEAEFGEDEFAPFGTMEDPNMLKDLGEGEGIDNKGLFQLMDSAGNPIKLKALVMPVDGVEKRGRVVRFADNGHGGTSVVVNWQWPIDMKYKNPKEMGEMEEDPNNLIVQNPKNMNEELNEELNENEVNEECGENHEELEEARGLGKGVKNMGNRNVKQRDDHQSAPLTNLNESVDNNIKKLFEGTVKRKDLISFIKEEGKRISKNI